MKQVLILIFMMGTVFITKAQTTSFDFIVNHQALSVKDVDKSAAFYSKVMGLPEITNRTGMPGIRWFSFTEGKELHLISTIKEPVQINKAVHIALTTAQFDAFVKHLDDLKISYSDWPGTAGKISIRADGIKQIFFQDPDGYWIEVNSVAVK
ncbi:MAG: VOC family protein [Chitinophagaceae bacterium]|nr:VOC family protein [Chitinophagaceae bacterium]